MATTYLVHNNLAWVVRYSAEHRWHRHRRPMIEPSLPVMSRCCGAPVIFLRVMIFHMNFKNRFTGVWYVVKVTFGISERCVVFTCRGRYRGRKWVWRCFCNSVYLNVRWWSPKPVLKKSCYNQFPFSSVVVPRWHCLNTPVRFQKRTPIF